MYFLAHHREKQFKITKLKLSANLLSICHIFANFTVLQTANVADSTTLKFLETKTEAANTLKLKAKVFIFSRFPCKTDILFTTIKHGLHFFLDNHMGCDKLDCVN